MYTPYRRAAQLIVLALMFLVPVLNVHEIYAVTGTFYAINIGRLGIADPVVILQAVFAAGELTARLGAAAVFPVFLALMLGRVWCGWMCPYHLLSDWAVWIRRKFRALVRGKTEVEPLPVRKAFSANMSRYGFLLLGTAVAGAIGIPVLNYLSAPGILSTEAMILVKSRHLSIEFGFIGIIWLLELTLLPRFWCRMFCPTGAFLGLFRGPFTLRINPGSVSPRNPCCKENHCSAACPMGLAPYREGHDLLCTNCGRCVDACAHGRLRFAGFKGTDARGRTRQEQRS
ncbi:MAG: 4Fe-4S binding protein [Thermodesulfobacteriota bacterium]